MGLPGGKSGHLYSLVREAPWFLVFTGLFSSELRPACSPDTSFLQELAHLHRPGWEQGALAISRKMGLSPEGPRVAP